MAVKSINVLDMKKKPYYQRTANKAMQQFTNVVPKLINVKEVSMK